MKTATSLFLFTLILCDDIITSLHLLVVPLQIILIITRQGKDRFGEVEGVDQASELWAQGQEELVSDTWRQARLHTFAIMHATLSLHMLSSLMRLQIAKNSKRRKEVRPPVSCRPRPDHA